MHKKLIKLACIVVVTMFFLHTLANTFYWYTAVTGFDKAMHVLGGVFLALLGGALFRKTIVTLSQFETVVLIALFSFVIGLLWEYYEYTIQYFIKGVELANFYDSIADLFADVFGALIGLIFVIRAKNKYTTDHDTLSR